MTEKRKRRNSRPKYPIELVRAVIYDVNNSTLTLAQIAAKYGMAKNSPALISRWVRKYSSNFGTMETNYPIDSTQLLNTSIEIPGDEKLLRKALQEAQMKIICLETMIDIAEKELNVSIRKKSGTKQ